MMHIRFPLSLRNVEDLLHERGIDVSHETIRYWWNRFGPLFAAEIRRKRIDRMPTPIWPGSQASQLAGTGRPKFQRPTPDSLIGNVGPAFGEQIFHIAITERKPEVRPDGVLDDLWWKSMAAVVDLFHHRSLAATGWFSQKITVTILGGALAGPISLWHRPRQEQDLWGSDATFPILAQRLGGMTDSVTSSHSGRRPRPPTFLDVFVSVAVLIVLVVASFILFGDNAAFGPTQVALTLAATLAAGLAWKNGHVWNDIRTAVVEGIASALPAIFILFAVGALIGSWAMSGTLVAMVYFALGILSPHFFYLSACLICALIAVSSWTTVGTIGVGMMGMAALHAISMTVLLVILAAELVLLTFTLWLLFRVTRPSAKSAEVTTFDGDLYECAQ
jgi:hypothetical protein